MKFIVDLVRLLIGTAAPEPTWFVRQDSFIGCGPAVATMALGWAGIDTVLPTNRNIWMFSDVAQHIQRSGGRAEIRRIGTLVPDDGTALVVLVRWAGIANHFVFVTAGNGRCWMHNPLGGSSRTTLAGVRDEMLGEWCVVVSR